jgi:hypothetical protein
MPMCSHQIARQGRRRVTVPLASPGDSGEVTVVWKWTKHREIQDDLLVVTEGEPQPDLQGPVRITVGGEGTVRL